MICPTTNLLRQLLRGELSDNIAALHQAHLEECDRCRRRFAELEARAAREPSAQ